MSTAARRIRVKRGPQTGASKLTVQKIDALIDNYIKEEQKLIKAKAEMDQIMADLEPMMKANDLENRMTAKGVAEYVAQRSNATTFIDPRKFKEEVTEDEFFRSITVGVTAAKKVLAEKALSRISKVTPGKAKPPVLKVRPRTDKD